MGNAAVKRDTITARRSAGIPHERARRRRAIVEAAIRAIEDHGTDAGLAAVADRAGLVRPHVYRYFAGKDDLDQAVARRTARLLSAWIRPALSAPGTPSEVVHGVIGRVLGWAVAHPGLYRFRARRAAADSTTAVVVILRAAGCRVQPPAYQLAGLVGLVDAGVIWWLDHPDEADMDQLNDWLAAQAWRVVAEVVEQQPVSLVQGPRMPEAM